MAFFLRKPKLVRTHNTSYEPVDCAECGEGNVYTECGVCLDCHSRPCSNHNCGFPRHRHSFCVELFQQVSIWAFRCARAVERCVIQNGERLGNMD